MSIARAEVLIFINSWPHVHEPAIPTGRVRTANGVVEAEVRAFMCPHGDPLIWIKPEDILSTPRQ